MVERKLRLAPQVTKISKTPSSKLFVLDTNVLMHDPTSLFRFEEHDIFLPMAHPRGTRQQQERHVPKSRATRARRAAISTSWSAAASAISDGSLAAGIPLKPQSGGAATGRLFLQTEAISTTCRRRSPAARPTTRSSPSSCTCSRPSRSASVILVSQRHQHAHQGACAGHLPPRTISTTRSSKTPICSTPACASCRRISGTATARAWNRGSRAATPITACTARCAAACWSTNSSISRARPGETPLYAQVREVTRQDRDPADA